MTDRCHHATDKEIGRYFLPFCMGGAVYGPHGCTCPERNAKADLEARVTELEKQVLRLSAISRLTTHAARGR